MIRASRLVATTIGLVALASSCMAQRQVVLTFDHAGPSNGAVEGEIRRSPITALTWDDRNGTVDVGDVFAYLSAYFHSP